MPFYEYKCEACGYDYEAFQKISDPPLTDCPECGQPALKKRVSAAAFRLKGSGWYETDFKSGNKKNLHESSDKKEAPAEKADKADKKEANPKKAETKPKPASPPPAA